MAQFRVSGPARADLVQILATSCLVWGVAARDRYALLLKAAMQKAASDPRGPATRDRSDLRSGLRSLHIRHARGTELGVRVATPVHILYFRVEKSGRIQILRVLHERMEPTLHFRAE